MKSKMNIKSIIIMFAIAVISMFFINMSFASNIGKVCVETANLRENANADGKILELISLNEEVEIIEETSGWYKVKYKGIEGYLREDLVSVNGESVDKSTSTENTNSENNSVETNISTENQNQEETNQAIDNQVQIKEEQQQNNVEIQTEATQEDSQLGKYIISEDTNLKIVPTINATNIIEVKKDEEVNVTEIINGWACIETKTTKGWIRQEKLKKPEKVEEKEEQPEETTNSEQVEEVPQATTRIQYVSSATVNLRKEPNTTCEVLTSLVINKQVEVLSEENGWSKVRVDGIEGYISTSLLSDTKQETSRSTESIRKSVEETSNNSTSNSESNTSTNTNSNVSASAVIATANQYIGSKYVYGGSSPSGFDCSGFTSYVYKQYGINLNRTAAGQYSNGVAVSKSDLQPGDLVMFGKSGINHVGIYLGGGNMIHAANPSRGVTTDTINSGYYSTNYVGARRVM